MSTKEKKLPNASKIMRQVDAIDPQVPAREVKTLFSWEASGRPFKKRTKNYYMSSILLGFLLSIIALLFHQVILILVIASFLFVAFALNTIPPKDFHYKISTEGITIEDHFFLWQELYDFYFKKRFDTIEILHIRTRTFLPGEITLTLKDEDKEMVKAILLHFLPYRELITPTFIDKAADWLNKNFPLEEPLSSTKNP